MTGPTCADVLDAARRIRGHVHRTPVVTSRTFDEEVGARIFFKCENLQKVGAFKARGATNAVLKLGEAAASRGVITHSSGNHGAALAYAASVRGIPATVVMPENAPRIKVEAVRGYGAEIVICAIGERQTVCDRLMEEWGATLIHPFEHPDVIAGQGTAADELIRQVGSLDLVVTPVGGGGLLSGTTLRMKSERPAVAVWGAEPETVDDACRSLESGVRQPANEQPNSVCDGLLTGLGELAFEILREHDVQVVTVSEEEILDAARSILERMKLVVEPSGATVLAALRRKSADLKGLRIGAVFSGGNTDFSWLCPSVGK